MRILLLALVASLAGCASSPRSSDPGQEAAAEAAQPVVHVAPDAASAEDEESTFKPPAGYKARVENGQTMYCRKTTVLGSRFPKDLCMTEAQMKEHEAKNSGFLRDMDQKSRVCAGGGACQVR